MSDDRHRPTGNLHRRWRAHVDEIRRAAAPPGWFRLLLAIFYAPGDLDGLDPRPLLRDAWSWLVESETRSSRRAWVDLDQFERGLEELAAGRMALTYRIEYPEEREQGLERVSAGEALVQGSLR